MTESTARVWSSRAAWAPVVPTTVTVAVVCLVVFGAWVLAGPATDWPWVGRAAVIAGIGAVAGLAAEQAGRARRHLDDAATERERALTGQRAALVQLVSHEFRTPLTIIRGSVETLRSRRGAVAPEFRALVEATDRSARRLEEMVDVVLAAADELDIDDTEHTAVPVDDLVHHAAVSIDADLVDRLLLDVPAGSRIVTVEPYLWLTVRCLLDNAVKFSPDGEPIEVTFRSDDCQDRLSLHDRGPGFPPGFEQVAFEPFTQADASVRREHPGLGMGLYTARRLARRLGGDIEVSSRVGLGVTATVVLPKAGAGNGDGNGRGGHGTKAIGPA